MTEETDEIEVQGIDVAKELNILSHQVRYIQDLLKVESPEVLYPYSVKIEQSAYGARVIVHTHEKVQVDACDAAIEMYSYTRAQLFKRGFKVAPEEDPKPKKENSNEK